MTLQPGLYPLPREVSRMIDAGDEPGLLGTYLTRERRADQLASPGPVLDFDDV